MDLSIALIVQNEQFGIDGAFHVYYIVDYVSVFCCDLKLLIVNFPFIFLVIIG